MFQSAMCSTHHLRIIVAIFLTAFPVSQAFSSVLLDMRFEDSSESTFTDDSGAENNGTPSGAVSRAPSGRDNGGNALQLEKTTGHLNLPKLDVSGAEISVAAWLYADSFPGSLRDPSVLSLSSGNSTQEQALTLGSVKTSTGVRLRLRIKINGSTHSLTATRGRLSTRHWHHVAAVYDGFTIRLLQDGVEVASKSIAGSITTSEQMSAAIGAQPDGRRSFHGLLDDIYVEKRALTLSEIEDLAQRGTSVPPDGLSIEPDAYSTNFETTLDISPEDGVLNNDGVTAIGGVTAQLVQSASFGLLLFESNGSFTYTPQQGFTGQDQFSYSVSDGEQSSSPALVTIDVQGVTGDQFLPHAVYNFDGIDAVTAIDSSGLGNNGEIVNASRDSQTIDGTVSSLRFNGSTSSIVVPTFDVPAAGMTLAAWIKADSFTGSARDPRVIAKTSANALSATYHTLGTMRVGRTTLPVFRLRVNGRVKTVRPDTTFDLETNLWYHLAATYDGSKATVYVNGEIAIVQTLGGPADQNNQIPVAIGSTPGGGKHFDGLIDSVLIAGRPLSASEIEEIATPDSTIDDPDVPGEPSLPALDSGAPAGQPVSYRAIELNTPVEFHLETDNEYLGEYLRQNPTVQWWIQNAAAGAITPLEAPQNYTRTISINSTGGDDTSTILNAAELAGFGGVVDGNNGEFRVRLMRVATAGVTFRNIKMVPFAGAGAYAVQVSAPDVRFINSPLDMLNKDFRYGVSLLRTADRFAMVGGGIINKKNTRWGGGSLLHILEGADDVYIVGNTFAHSYSSVLGRTARGIHFQGTPSVLAPNSIGGIVASNLIEDMQSRDYKEDADGLTISGFSGNNMFETNLLALANRGINAGKRTLKAISGGVDAHSNFSWWRDSTGPRGRRSTWTHYDGLGVSKTRWTNNVAITDASNPGSESYFMALQTHQFAAQYNTFDIVYQNNVYHHNDTTAGNRASYVFRVADFDGNNITNWPVNSEVSNNYVRGTGEVEYIWKFFGGNDPYGEQFRHEGNVIELQYENEYRPYPIR